MSSSLNSKKFLFVNPLLIIISAAFYYTLPTSSILYTTIFLSLVSLLISISQNKAIISYESFVNGNKLKESDKFNEIVNILDNNASTFNSSFEVLVSASDDVLKKTEQSSNKTGFIRKKTHDINKAVSTISNTMEDSSANVNLIAAAVEEMSATINEIAANTGLAKKMADGAFNEVEKTSSNMEKLDREVEKIGNVTETISEISEQTNLLALNATIEAARAGEYGKGFAVVANEIKVLAKQTAEATLEIKEKIEGIQNTTAMTVNDAGKVIKAIEEIGEIVSVIAVAIEEQTATTNEISANILKAAQGVNDVNQNLTTSSNAFLEIENEIVELNANHKEILENALEQNLISKEVAKMAEKLKEVSAKYINTESRFPIGDIKKAHLNWRVKLESALKGYKDLCAEQLVDHHHCELGKWYDSAKNGFNGNLAFKELGKVHKDVHDIIYKIVDLKEKGRAKEAENYLDTFENSRIKLFDTLDELYSMHN